MCRVPRAQGLTRLITALSAQCDLCGIARSCFPTSSKKAETHSLAYGHLLCLSPLIERHNQKEIRRAYRRQRVVVGSYGPGWSDSGHHQQLTSRLRQSLPRFLSRFPFPHPFTSCRSAKPRREARSSLQKKSGFAGQKRNIIACDRH